MPQLFYRGKPGLREVNALDQNHTVKQSQLKFSAPTSVDFLLSCNSHGEESLQWPREVKSGGWKDSRIEKSKMEANSQASGASWRSSTEPSLQIFSGLSPRPCDLRHTCAAVCWLCPIVRTRLQYHASS